MTDREKERRMKQMRAEFGKQPTTAAEWITAKARFPNRFTVDKDGNFLSPPINPGDSEKIIVVEPEVPAGVEQIKGFFAKRQASLKEPEESYTSAKRHLQEVMTAYRAGLVTVADVLDANHLVHIAECTLNSAAKFPRKLNTDLTGALAERDLSFQHYADRSIAEKVVQVTYTTFPWEAFWTASTASDVSEEGKEEEQKQEEQEVKPKRTLTPQQRAIIASRRKGFGGAT